MDKSLLLVAGLVATPLIAQTRTLTDSVPVFIKDPASLIVALPVLSRAPSIDGVPDDSVWSEARQLTDFVQYSPSERRRGRRKSTGYIAYDAENLYFAFIAEDDEANIRATVFPRERGGNADDRVT